MCGSGTSRTMAAMAIARALTTVAAVAAAGLSLSPTPARAQPAPPAASDSAPPVEADPALRARYDEAFARLVAGDFAAAAAGFEAVAAETGDPAQAAAARELGRLARDLANRGARLILPTPSQSPPAATAARPPTPDDEPDSGRTGFVVTTTLASFYSGFVLLDLLDVDSLRGGVAVVTATTAVGFLASLYGSRGRTLTAPTSDAYTLGMMLGAGNALLLSGPLGLYDDDASRESVELFVLGGVAAGGTAGILLGQGLRPTRAQVSVTSTLSLLGIGSALLGFGILQPSDADEDAVLLTLTAGLDGGAAAGFLVAPRIDWSVSRARMVSLGTFLGALGGFATGVFLVGTPEDDDGADGSSDDDAILRGWSATTLAGMWGGFGLSWYLTRGMKPDARFAPPGPGPIGVQLLPAPLPGGGGIAVAGSF
jgi:hypothetical protein